MTYQRTIQRIHSACLKNSRDTNHVCLIGASKQQNPDTIKSRLSEGLVHLGENYLQEALEKKAHLQKENIVWHFIGHLQTRKAKLAATHFDWIHSVSTLKLAQKLSQYRQQDVSLNILIQVNIDNEDSKSGVCIAEASALCAQVHKLPNLQLQGLMAIPQHNISSEKKHSFLRLQKLRDDINKEYDLQMTQLSMGMSKDFELAIKYGSTMVRIGRDLFGERLL